MEALSKSFENAHGSRLKSAFAETLIHLMYSVAKVSRERYQTFHDVDSCLTDCTS